MLRPERCTCCGEPITDSGWERMPLVGYYRDEVETLEMRNHRCGSTLSALIEGGDDAS